MFTFVVCGVPPVAVMVNGTSGLFVNEKLAGAATFGAEAVTLYAPAVVFAVKTAEVATPEALVMAVLFTPSPAKVPLAPLEGAMNVTVTPPTGFPLESFTIATRVAANAVFTTVLCGVPPVAVMVPTPPGCAFVSEKTAGFATPGAVAFTVKEPITLFATKAFEVALPEASVTAAFGFAPGHEQLAPLAPGTGVNVTVTPGIGLPNESFRVATRGNVNAVFTGA